MATKKQVEIINYKYVLFKWDVNNFPFSKSYKELNKANAVILVTDDVVEAINRATLLSHENGCYTRNFGEMFFVNRFKEEEIKREGF